MSNTDSKTNTVEWDDINWRKVEKYVYKLQKNIYAASRRGEIRKVRQLQKTLMSSWSNKVLAVRRITQDNRGKKTAGVDGIKSLSPKARMKLVGQLKIKGKSKPTRRVWIPKPGKEEKRPLGIPTIYDRALQAVLKNALEPEWEAIFEASSYGFRPGRSCHDAIKHIKSTIQQKPKYVLDADIAKCFDKINHTALLQKLEYTGKVRQQIKAWLKSGVIDQEAFTATSEGTPQGGTVSPLLSNIALHGMINMIKEYAKTLILRDKNGEKISPSRSVKSLTLIRYADDFLVFHNNLEVIYKCRDLISLWLKDIGLELEPSKTRIAHTLNPNLSEDGKAGFDFLGHHIQQFPIGVHSSARDAWGNLLRFRTLIIPSKEACKKHQKKIKEVIDKYRHDKQEKLISELNPIIRGWANYYSNSDASTTGVFTKQDNLVYLKLRAWGIRRCKNLNEAHKKYWIKIKENNWVFAAKEGNSKPYRLLSHGEIGSSSTKYVKVKGEVSPFDGNSVYWSTRMGRNPDMSYRKSNLLKAQKGICSWCNLRFHEGDILEEDHIIATALGGNNSYDNLQLLHGHCHDEKTAFDMEKIWKIRMSKHLREINKILNKSDWFWDSNDILIIQDKAGSTLTS